MTSGRASRPAGRRAPTPPGGRVCRLLSAVTCMVSPRTPLCVVITVPDTADPGPGQSGGRETPARIEKVGEISMAAQDTATGGKKLVIVE